MGSGGLTWNAGGSNTKVVDLKNLLLRSVEIVLGKSKMNRGNRFEYFALGYIWAHASDDDGVDDDTIRYHMMPYYTIWYHTIPYDTIGYHTIPYDTILYPSIPYYIIRYQTIPYDTILYDKTLFYCHHGNKVAHLSVFGQYTILNYIMFHRQNAFSSSSKFTGTKSRTCLSSTSRRYWTT